MRRKIIEEPVNHDRWLVSYADFITLLFAFFVVMYSISQISESKYRILSNTLSEAFKLPAHELDPIQVGELAKSNPISLVELKKGLVVEDDRHHEESSTDLEPPPQPLEQISDAVEKAFGDLIDQRKITLRGNEEWLELEMNSSLLFDSGDAVLSNKAIELLGDIAAILKPQSNPVRVEGFTDSVPIRSNQFPSNWELSTARAAAVVKLFTEEGIAPSRLAAVGYGEFQPVADNTTDEGRARNRRVVLMISKSEAMRPDLAEVHAPASAPASVAEGPVVGAEDSGESIAPDQTAPENIPVSGSVPLQGVRRIELDDGGLLFTSEPANTESADQ